jgi:hypothetical protein
LIVFKLALLEPVKVSHNRKYKLWKEYEKDINNFQSKIYNDKTIKQVAFELYEFVELRKVSMEVVLCYLLIFAQKNGINTESFDKILEFIHKIKDLDYKGDTSVVTVSKMTSIYLLSPMTSDLYKALYYNTALKPYLPDPKQKSAGVKFIKRASKEAFGLKQNNNLQEKIFQTTSSYQGLIFHYLYMILLQMLKYIPSKDLSDFPVYAIINVDYSSRTGCSPVTTKLGT